LCIQACQLRWAKVEVTATAYTSTTKQTNENPFIGAWGDSLKPSVKSIAVSRDLLSLGLKQNTKVRIEGIEGIFLVRDKMNKRWKKRIDIYMGTDYEIAKNWGKKRVVVYYKD